MINLLDLPSEIRLEILRQLLVLGKPVQARYKVEWVDLLHITPTITKPTWSTWPAHERPTGQILWTCKQLYNEGIDMLYNENTFAITIIGKAKSEPREAADFLGFHTLQQAFNRYPRLNQVRRWALDINMDPDISRRGADGLTWLMGRLVREMQKLCHQRLQSLNVNVTNGYGVSAFVYLEHRGMFTELGLLRSDSARISGVDSEYASSNLTKLIMSHKPVIDITRLFEAYVPSMQDWGWKSFAAAVQYEFFMLFAMLDWDVELLSKLHSSVAEMYDAPDSGELIRRVREFGLWPKGAESIGTLVPLNLSGD